MAGSARLARLTTGCNGAGGAGGQPKKWAPGGRCVVLLLLHSASCGLLRHRPKAKRPLNPAWGSSERRRRLGWRAGWLPARACSHLIRRAARPGGAAAMTLAAGASSVCTCGRRRGNPCLPAQHSAEAEGTAAWQPTLSRVRAAARRTASAQPPAPRCRQAGHWARCGRLT